LKASGVPDPTFCRIELPRSLALSYTLFEEYL